MAYKVRHKGKPKRRGLEPGLAAPAVQVVLIVAGLITAVVMPRPAKGATDIVNVVALAAAGAGAVLGGLTYLVKLVLGRRAKEPRVAGVVTLLYRASLVLIVSGLAAAFYRTVFR